MTISSTDRIAGPFAGAGSTGPFAFTFNVPADADLYLVTVDTSDDSETELTLTTDYTVSRNADQVNNPGGSVTLVAALAVGTNLLITTNRDALQEKDIQNQGAFLPQTIEDGLDLGTIIDQQQQGELDRCLKIPITSTSETDLPYPEAETVIGYDDSDPPELTNYSPAEWVALVDSDTVSVSSNDTTPGYLNGKLVAGAEISLTEGSDGGDETLTIAIADGTAGTLLGYAADGSPTEVGPGTAAQVLTSNGLGAEPTFQAPATQALATVSANDTTPGYLNGKIVAGTNVTLTEGNDGGDETLTIAAHDYSVKVTANDTSANYLAYKIAAGTGITLTETNDGGDEDLTISVTGGVPAASDATPQQMATAGGPGTSSDFSRADHYHPSAAVDDLKGAGAAVVSGSVGVNVVSETQVTIEAHGGTHKFYVFSVYGAVGCPKVIASIGCDATNNYLNLRALSGSGTCYYKVYRVDES